MGNELLNTLNKCVRCKLSYFNKFTTKSKSVLLVEKYTHLNTFEIICLSENGKHVNEIYRNLSPFDCFDMVRELMEN